MMEGQWKVLALLLVSLPYLVVSSNYHVYNYDMTTPQFTPDGRLMQVEYASSATAYSKPIVALQAENDTLVLLSLKDPNTPQNRLILMPAPYSPICVAMSGVLADSIALLQVAMQQAALHYRAYHKPLTVLQLATAMANACQKNSFGGGIRPYGSTMLACGFSESKLPVLYQTDPSGGLLQASFPTSTQKQPASLLKWIVGGQSELQLQLRKRLESSLSKHQRQHPESSLVDKVAIAARVLLDEVNKRDKRRKGLHRAPLSLEVVVMTPAMGCHRLSPDQMHAILERIQ